MPLKRDWDSKEFEGLMMGGIKDALREFIMMGKCRQRDGQVMVGISTGITAGMAELGGDWYDIITVQIKVPTPVSRLSKKEREHYDAAMAMYAREDGDRKEIQ
jgi:hypothetical protein